MKCLFAAVAAFLASAAYAAPTEEPGEAVIFRAAAAMYKEGKQDKAGAAEAFRRFADRFSRSPRAADALFSAGEIDFERALALSDADPAYVRDRLNARVPDAAAKALKDAEEAYTAASKKASDDALRATALYRLGELAYNQRDWAKAALRFKEAADGYPKSYAVPAALLGTVYSALAKEDFAAAESGLSALAAGYPERMKDAEVAFVEGVLALHKKDYARAEKLLASLETQK